MLQVLADRWWVVLLRGILAIGAGIATLAWPGLTLVLLIFLIGISALVDGLACIFMGFGGGSEGRPWWEMILLGLVGAGFGIATLAWPGLTGILLLSLIAGWAIARGIMEIIVAIRLRKVIDNEIMMGLSGLLSIGFGALLIMYPGEGALAMAMFIGAFLIAVGVTAVILSFRLKGLKSKLRGMA
ncbi:MAG: HdeD family acid-resistance protein [Planctomycetales bacterium]|nr:HdeD family acid-resistance protein [Planctomycetales bacterium]